MLASATTEQSRAQAEHANAARAAEEAAAIARDTEFGAVTARLANDNCCAERRTLELQGGRGALMPSALSARTAYVSDGPMGGTMGGAAAGPTVQTRQRSSRAFY